MEYIYLLYGNDNLLFHVSLVQVQSQEEVISELTRQLREVRQENASLQASTESTVRYGQVALSQVEEWISKETLLNKRLSRESSELVIINF